MGCKRKSHKTKKEKNKMVDVHFLLLPGSLWDGNE